MITPTDSSTLLGLNHARVEIKNIPPRECNSYRTRIVGCLLSCQLLAVRTADRGRAIFRCMRIGTNNALHTVGKANET